MRYAIPWTMGISLVLGGCGGSDTASSEQEAGSPSVLLVHTVNYPLQYFAARIGGDAVEALCPIPEGVDPSQWWPGSEAVARFQEADLILLNGADYAKWIKRVTLPENRMINTSRLVADRYLPQEGAVTHTHGPEGDHAHGALAFTTWLDPTLALEQARAVLEALVQARPESGDRFRASFAELEAELGELDLRLAIAARTLGNRPILFSHPVYQYLEQRYELNGLSLHWEPDDPPSEARLDELREILETHRARVLFWEDEPLKEMRSELAFLGIRSAVYAPAAGVPASGDFMSIMQRNVTAFETVANQGP